MRSRGFSIEYVDMPGNVAELNGMGCVEVIDVLIGIF